MLLGANTAIVARGRNSLVSFLRVSVEPVLIVLCLVASSLSIGKGFGAPELMLALFAFSLTFPGEVSVRRLRQNLRSTILVNWLSMAALLGFTGWGAPVLQGHNIP